MMDFIKNIFKKELGWSSVFSVVLGNTGKSVKSLYFGTIYSCTDAIATKVSDVSWGLYQNKGVDKSTGAPNWVEVTKHPIIDQLKRPNKYQTFTDMMYLMSTHIDAAGQIAIYPVRTSMSSGRIVELHLLNPLELGTETDSTLPYNNIVGYNYRHGGRSFKFAPEEIINIIRPNPFDQTKGISTIQMSRYEGTSELNSADMNNAFYENGAFPGGIISTDQQIAPEVHTKLKAQIKERYEGSKNAFKLMFLTHGMKYESPGVSQKDMQYIDTRKLNRDQIFMIFKTPKSIMAVSDQLNKATAQVEYQAFIANVVKPRLELIFDKLNMFLLPLYDLDGSYRLRYKDPVPVDPEQELAEKTASCGKWRTPNEIRNAEGKEPLEGGDELNANAPPVINMNPDDTEDDDDQDGKKKHIHLVKESDPDPKKVRGRENKEYTRKRNAYTEFKLPNYTNQLSSHYSQLIRDINKAPIKKDAEDDFENSPEVIFDKVMPKKEKQRQWQLLLYLLLLKNNTQIWKSTQKQLNEVYDLKINQSETIERLIAARATMTSKSMADTTFKTIKHTIATRVAEGNTDLRDIKREVSNVLKDQKPWKSDQIARTELTWAYGQAQRYTYIDNGVTQVKWICGSDPCDICADNEGEVRKIGDNFPSGHENEPVHPDCKCETIPVF